MKIHCCLNYRHIISSMPRTEVVGCMKNHLFTNNGSFKSMAMAIEIYEINANFAP